MSNPTDSGSPLFGNQDEVTSEHNQVAQQSGHQNVLLEIAKALKSLRYGTIVLTVHEGEVVELSKTVRLRTRAKFKS
jgi:hypothetical protein